jgi:hypothetical protein
VRESSKRTVGGCIPHWTAVPREDGAVIFILLETDMYHLTHMPIQGVVSVITGILILMMPKLLNYFVAIYLIVTGILMIMKY